MKTKICHNCGAEIHEESMFCHKCGEETGVKKCPKCGYKLSDGSRFCTYCGTEIENNSVNNSQFNDTKPEEHGEIEADEISVSVDESHGKGKILKKILSWLGMIIAFILGRYYWATFIMVFMLAGIMYLIMCKGLKMKGEELPIVFLTVLHVSWMVASGIILAAIDSLELGTVIGYLAFLGLDILLSAALILLSGLFYYKKDKAYLIAIICIELLYTLINCFNLFGIVESQPDQILIMLCHIAWRCIVIFLCVKYHNEHFKLNK